MTGHYPFLITALPPLKIGQTPPISFDELMWMIQLNVKDKDLQQVRAFRKWIDLNNIYPLYLGKPIDVRGNLREKELDEALLLNEFFPSYVFDFLSQWPTKEDTLVHLAHLFLFYLEEEEKKQTGFLKEYFAFERALRLVLLAIKSKELGKDVEKQLQFEDLKDPLILEILAQKDALIYIPPPEFISLKEKYLGCGLDPWEQSKMMLRWKFDQIEEFVKADRFSINSILAYMAKLLLVEEEADMDFSKGEMILEAFVG